MITYFYLLSSLLILSILINKRIVFTHNHFFVWGIIAYLIFPLIIPTYTYFNRYFADVSLWYNFYFSIPPQNFILFISWTLFALAAFFMGGYAAKLKFKLPAPPEFTYTFRFNKLLIFPFLGICILLIILKIFQYQQYLFKGYTVEKNLASGQFMTINFYLLILFWMNQLFGDPNQKNKWLTALLILVISVNTLLVLSLGMRISALTIILTLLIYYNTYKTGFPRILIIPLLLVGLLGVSLAGFWREGISLKNYNPEWGLYFIMPEFQGTSYSLVSFLANRHFPLFAIPYEFFAALINFIPVDLFPQKKEWIDYIYLHILNKYPMSNPFGAVNVFVTLVRNFGLIGSVFVLFCMGYLLSYLKERSVQNISLRYYYVLWTAYVPFIFFREEYSAAIKTFLIVTFFPLLLLAIDHAITTFIELIQKSNSH